MKHLGISVALLAAIFCTALANTVYLSTFTQDLTDQLFFAQEKAAAGNWEEALALTQQAHQNWEKHGTYLHITLQHEDIDNVYLFFLQTEQFLSCQKEGEYAAANAALMGHLTLLREQEELTLKNIL